MRGAAEDENSDGAGRLAVWVERANLEACVDSETELAVRFEEAEGARWLCDAFGGFDVDDEIRLEGTTLHIVVPERGAGFDRLERALATILAPEAIFLDMDGVLADVADSYREAIRLTAAHFGLEVSAEDVSHAKAGGDANNDWRLLERMLAEAGIEESYEEIKAVYERLYQGEDGEPGLWRHESLIVALEELERLGTRLPLGIVTGRPRRDAERFFEQTGLDEKVEAVVVMEDAPQKPEPDPVELLAERMGVERAWMLGDTPDDARAARRAGMLALGIVAPDEDASRMRPALRRGGCARILDDLTDLHELLDLSTGL